MSLTLVISLSCRIFSQIFVKIRNGSIRVIRDMGKTHLWKNKKLKISGRTPFKSAASSEEEPPLASEFGAALKRPGCATVWATYVIHPKKWYWTKKNSSFSGESEMNDRGKRLLLFAEMKLKIFKSDFKIKICKHRLYNESKKNVSLSQLCVNVGNILLFISTLCQGTREQCWFLLFFGEERPRHCGSLSSSSANEENEQRKEARKWVS